MGTRSNHNRNRNRLPKINWGRGRLIKHESFVSFAAKFCRLNRLTPKQFRVFWNTSINVIDSDHQEEKISLIARILDEPKLVVRTVFENRRLDKSWNLMDTKSNRNWYDSISYCPECLSGGFHGNFHESDWLKKCPIHYINLTSETLHYSPKMKIDRYLSQFLCLLDLKCPGWGILDIKCRLKKGKKESKLLNKFLSWRAEAEKYVDRWPKKCVGIFGSNFNCELNEDGRAFSRHYLLKQLSWFTPKPEDLNQLFTDSPHYTELEILQFPRVTANELLSLLSTSQWHELLDAYKFVSFPNGAQHTFKQIAEAEINNIVLRHPPQKCDCTWGVNSSHGLIKCSPGELKYYGNYYCPYEFAKNKLYDNWLNNDLKHREISGNFIADKTMPRYNKPAIIFGYSFEGRNGSKELNWSFHLHHLFRKILEKVVFAEICEISTWLASINNDIPPTFRKRARPNIYLVQSKRSEMHLISWPPNRNYSYE